jgi:DNA replication ATP-dependent helicase Dna2
LNPSDLAVITPYRQQIKLLTGLFADMPSVEILTADKSQGRDKECILISLVRSNASGYVSRGATIVFLTMTDD